MNKNGLKIIILITFISIIIVETVIRYFKTYPNSTILFSNKNKLSQIDFSNASKLLKMSKEKLNGFRLLTKLDMDKDSLKSFEEYNSGTNPGFFCDHLINDNEISCATILVTENRQNPRVGKVVIISPDQEGGTTHIYDVENYLADEASNSKVISIPFDGYLIPITKKTIENRGDGANRVEMSRNGVQLIFEGKSSLVFWFENGNILKYWISD